MEIDNNGLEVLEEDECLRLLAGATLGRVALSRGALPTILPVNFHFDGERILVLTTSGSKLEAAMRSVVVAFEVDDFDTLHRAGWSVVVVGQASVVSDPAELEALDHAPLTRWAPSGDDCCVIAISTDMVSGRRMRAMLPTAPRLAARMR